MHRRAGRQLVRGAEERRGGGVAILEREVELMVDGLEQASGQRVDSERGVRPPCQGAFAGLWRVRRKTCLVHGQE